ncbi:V-set domain-containing T-cell activation inhibitor 1-like [Stegostoma tigrinum]|uniref:V-set domain-containing T-cell activation inhibitor 1-like n=1 Tax=Stegostoma tigrinum TaxID=3053191 RepID=UPI00202B7CF2|nr:V-set domain-containing T-cell activation inhibitor 1-like [Stegostoma tigrinum]
MLRALCCLILLQFPQFEAFDVICDQDVVTAVGKDVTLKCTFGKGDSNPTVIWEKVGEEQSVHEYRNDADDFSEQHRNYTKRTALGGSRVKGGDASLTLKNVNVWDEGRYKCSVNIIDGFGDATVVLSVWARGSGNVGIVWKSNGDNGDVLTCQSSGLYPAPEIKWEDKHGKNLNEVSETNLTRDKNGLYSVDHYLKQNHDSKNQYICSVWHKYMGKPQRARVAFTDGNSMIRLDDGEPSLDL